MLIELSRLVLNIFIANNLNFKPTSSPQPPPLLITNLLISRNFEYCRINRAKSRDDNYAYKNFESLEILSAYLKFSKRTSIGKEGEVEGESQVPVRLLSTELATQRPGARGRKKMRVASAVAH